MKSLYKQLLTALGSTADLVKLSAKEVVLAELTERCRVVKWIPDGNVTN